MRMDFKKGVVILYMYISVCTLEDDIFKWAKEVPRLSPIHTRSGLSEISLWRLSLLLLLLLLLLPSNEITVSAAPMPPAGDSNVSPPNKSIYRSSSPNEQAAAIQKGKTRSYIEIISPLFLCLYLSRMCTMA